MFGAFNTFGKLGAIGKAIAAAWSPLSLWPDGIATPGMWISPRDLTSEWQDYTGTTPVVTPGTVADSSNPVGLALDIRAGAPGTLGPEVVTNGDFATDTDWTKNAGWTISGGAAHFDGSSSDKQITQSALTAGKWYEYIVTATNVSSGKFCVWAGPGSGVYFFEPTGTQTFTGIIYAGTTTLSIYATAGSFSIDNISVREIPGNHMLQSTSAARPLVSAYDGQTLGPGDTYSSTGYPIFQKYDGVDDGMATAAFSAGTLIDGMDCMIPVRRDGNSQQSLGGLYQLDETKYFGVIGTDSGILAGTHNGCGTPSIFVDNVAVSNTRGALYDAIGLGEWHILEYRDLDMSAWVNAGFGYYASGYQLIGARGDILLFPSTASTEDKDAARQYLADYYGVTLP